MFANILFCLHKYLPCPFLRKDLTLFCPVHENQLISYSTQSQYLKTTPPSDLIQNKLKPASLGTDWIENERFAHVFAKTSVFMPKTGSINSGTVDVSFAGMKWSSVRSRRPCWRRQMTSPIKCQGKLLKGKSHRIFFRGDFFKLLYSALLHLPPLRFDRVRGGWDRTKDCSDFGIGSHIVTTWRDYDRRPLQPNVKIRCSVANHKVATWL